MFDLSKDIDKYKGTPPYASEHYGIYQPLLGWESNLTKKWIRRGGTVIDPRVKSILDGRLLPGPTKVEGDDGREFFALPLQPGAGKSPYRVALAKNLNSELLRLVQAKVQAFVDARKKGELPKDGEWKTIIDINNLMDDEKGDLRKTNDFHRARLYAAMLKEAQGRPVTEEMRQASKSEHLDVMQYESQIATFLLNYAEAHGDSDPNELRKLFTVNTAPELSEIFRSNDPLANIDPLDKEAGALSPVGYVHLFRQYFFDLGTFLGEPVEHVWLAPGTTIELIEVNTRKTIIERTEESSQEITSRTEQSSAVKDEISDAVKAENASSTKLGVSTTHTVNYGVYQGIASASLGVETTRKDAREESHKATREQAEKISSEIKRSFKSVFKTVTETTDTRSRRYVLENKTGELLNYELRRKMRRVGVQMQGVGTRLCWQVFVDDTGSALGLSELVHFAESPDLSSLKKAEVGPRPSTIPKRVAVPIPFKGRNTDDYGPGAVYGNRKEPEPGVFTGNRINTNDEDAEDAEIVLGPFTYKCDPPQSRYLMKEVRIQGPQGNKLASGSVAEKLEDGSFKLIMDTLNFGGEPQILLDVDLVFEPHPDLIIEHDKNAAAADAKYKEDEQQLLEKAFMESVRQRIKDARNIKSRPSWDLREEERTIVYRALIKRLMLDSWGLPETDASRRLSHIRSEVIRAIFDVDAMLYFVAPEWWMPRRHKSQYDGTANFHLTERDLVKWDDLEKRRDNYKITEDSQPAKFGSSLGWLLQLDGDNLRNAFLNAPWVKAVIPIRPGREKAALNWLHHVIEGHENDGWNATYTAVNVEDAALLAAVVADGNLPTIGNVLEKIAEQLEKENGSIENVLKSDEVFEFGFNPLGKNAFDASVDPNRPFSQWISILPTDQIVAMEYKPTDLLVP